jgi:hypothetical protein
VLALGTIYRAKGAGLFLVAHGEQGNAGWLAIGRGSPVFSSSKGVGFGSWQSTREERGNKIKEQKRKIFFLPLLHVQGKKK